MRPLDDISAALTLLTRLPVPSGPPRPDGAWAWPLAGLVVGALAALVGAAAMGTGLPPGLAAALALGTQILATGGLHEDGLADSADGLWGGHSPQRRLEIMRDSRVGSYGVLALILVVLVRWQALTLLAGAGALLPGLLLAGAISRVPMAALMSALPPARPDGLSRLVGRPAAGPVALAALLCAGLVLALWPAALLPALVLAPLPALWLGRLARQRLGGQTGDILGASQQLTEMATLSILCATL